MLTRIRPFNIIPAALNTTNNDNITQDILNRHDKQDIFVRAKTSISFSGKNKELQEEKLKLKSELYSPTFDAEKFFTKLQNYHDKGGSYKKFICSDLMNARASLHLSDVGNLFEMGEDYTSAKTFYKFALNSYKALPITYKNVNTMKQLVMNESRIQKKIDNETKNLYDKMLENFNSEDFNPEKFYKDLYDEKFIKYGSVDEFLDKAEKSNLTPETKIHRLMEIGTLFLKDSQTVIDKDDVMQNPKYKEILRDKFEHFAKDNDYKEYDDLAWRHLNIYMKHTGYKFFGQAISLDNGQPEDSKYTDYILSILKQTDD